MTQSSAPWDGITTGDAGPYSSADWSLIWKYAFGIGGARANVGPFLGSGTSPNNGLKVQAQSPAAAAVDVLIGSAMVAGRFYLNDATVALTIAANASGNPRIDTVILRSDYSLQTIVLAVLQGTPAVSPTPPSLTQTIGTLYEIPLADVAVANGFTSISNSNITPRQEWINAANGIYLDGILNNSGVTLQTGDVVIWDTTADRAVTTTTTADDPKLAGVWIGRTSNGGYGRVLIHGIGYVNTSAAVTRGNLLTSTTVTKQAAQNTTGISYVVLGRALETTSGAGLAIVFVSVKRLFSRDFVHVQDQKASSTNAASVASAAWRTRELNTEVVDTSSLASVAANQITLAAGIWEVWATAANSLASAAGRLRLRDTTGGTTLVQGSNSGQALATGVGGTALVLYGFFTITVQSVLELQQYVTATGAGGSAVTTGEVEVYANVFLQRFGEVA